MKYCAEIEVVEDGEYTTHYVTALNPSMRSKAIERLSEDAEINYEKYWTE